MPDGYMNIHFIGSKRGESIVISLPNDDLIVIDNYSKLRDGKPINFALHIIQKLYPRCKTQLVVLTHPHYDHTKGLAELIRAVEPAEFACGFALHPVLFLEYMTRSARDTLDIERSYAAKELFDILSVVKSKRIRNRSLVGSNLLISIPEYAFYAFSVAPITQRVVAYNRRFGSKYAKGGLVYSSPDNENRVSGGLCIRFHDAHIMLLGDCDSTALGDITARCECSPLNITANLLKVPHHGSSSSLNEEFYSKLVDTDTIAVICPFLSVGLPDPQVVHSIGEAVGEVHVANADYNGRLSQLPSDDILDFASKELCSGNEDNAQKVHAIGFSIFDSGEIKQLATITV